MIDKSTKSQIISDTQIKKFCMYGFLKNLAFFKPYLLIYLMHSGLSFFEIGILYSVREFVVYIFEVPSGIIADYYGRKKELCLCFIFYIVSFIVFYFADSLYVAIVAMIFFGLGEAFRSGTHKAMILSYLEIHNWKSFKTFVYGRTRSFSLLGSAINSLIAIVIVVFASNYSYIFLFSIAPYILDFILIATYPSYLDGEREKSSKKVYQLIGSDMMSTIKDATLRRVVFNQSIFQGVLKSTKDMMQPVISIVILSYGAFNLAEPFSDHMSEVVIGITYFFISLVSSFCSRNSYRLLQCYKSSFIVNATVIALAIDLMLISFGMYLSNMIICILLFFLLNIMGDVRKPIYLDLLDAHMNKKLRATIISIESQITAIVVMIISPVFGYLADTYSISVSMAVFSIFIFIIYFEVQVMSTKET